MITIEDIKKWSKPHPISINLGGDGRMCCFGNKEVEFSIVGGEKGLYGDFDKTFEVAIFNKESNDFVTKFFYPEGSDDVIGWMNVDEVEKLVNSVIKKEELIIEE
jgi:hypothetical protein